MEAAQLGPRGGERARDPGNPALERAGDESTAGSGDNGQAAPPGGIESAGATRGSHEGPSRDPDNGKHEGAGRPRSTERPQNSGEWTTEDPGDGASEGSWKPRLSPGSPRDDERPSAGSITRTGSPRTHERAGITGTRSSGFPVTPGPGVSERSGVPRRSSHEGAIDSRANSESQWTAGPTSTEGANLTQPHGERGSHEASIASGTSQSEESTSSRASSGQGPLAPGTNSSQELHAPGSREKWLNTGSTVGEGTPVTNNGDGSLELRTTPSRASTMERAGDAWATDSFKKPISPAGPAGNEKTMEPRSKPAQPSPNTSSSLSSRASSTEASPDACHGLPSDAYRATPAIPYREPSWSGLPGSLYSLEILRGGSIASTKSLEGVSWTLFGRLPGCHVSLEHPSVSRYHAVLQYRQLAGSEPDQEPGFYIYDLGSTHGTFLNKQRIQSKTYCRFRVGHVLKFGGSTRLFILQGPEEDQEAESELSVTQIKEARRQKETLQKKMLGEDSDEEDLPEEGESSNVQSGSGEDGGGCMWGMGEDALEEENDENPIALEFQEDREALYLKNPKKALQGFYDREGEELEYEYEQQGCNTWLCRVKLPVDDSLGKQLVAEALHSGKKKEAAIQCALEACRILDSRGLLRQEAVSRKRKAKQWEDDDYYDSDDDTFLDRTGLVEKKRLNRMKKAGKIEEKPETFDSLVAKLNLVDVELAEIATKLQTSQTGEMHSSAQDSLDAFMTEIKSESSLDSVSRKKLHLRSFELKKEQQRLKGLIKIVQPTKLPELCSTVDDSKKKKLQLPMFGAMKGGRKFKLKTGTVGKLPPKRTDLPAGFFSMKASNNEPEEEEEEEEDEPEQEECMQVETTRDPSKEPAVSEKARKATPAVDTTPDPTEAAVTENRSSCVGPNKNPKDPSPSGDGEEFPKSKSTVTATDENKEITSPKQKRVHGPSRPPQNVPPSRYPEDDPDYCVWTPPAGQTGDGKNAPE